MLHIVRFIIVAKFYIWNTHLFAKKFLNILTQKRISKFTLDCLSDVLNMPLIYLFITTKSCKEFCIIVGLRKNTATT